MTKRNSALNIANIPQINYYTYLIKWLVLALIIGACIGSVTAFFLTSLDWATNWRENHLWIIALLPIGGLAIGLMYHYWGETVVKGNNQLLEEFHSPKKIIPLRMAPLVLLGTIITHFFGGSAGREGTAVQMGGAIADQFTKLFKLKNRDRKIILIMGISAGFAAVFGTPLAGAIFALEVLVLGRVRYEAILPSFLVAVIANYVCELWNVSHTHYAIPTIPEMDIPNLFWTITAGILFGLVALLFSKTTHTFGNLFKNTISYPPLRPFIGGIFIALIVWGLGTTKYIGLGVPTIVDAFNGELPQYDFIIKLLLTAFTLGAGFKGGEVTPLFFIGATLGNALFFFVPLPIALLAGMGFVAVFSGATNTPIACTFMGIELFGVESGLYIGIACMVAYLFSGHTGIYSSQIIGSPKHLLYGRTKGKHLNQL
ncbi:voltage-gated chloride channel family protein [uncultured Flavobacterium sp.]|uniref:voltage-gated chloride channel family protein n=1 Tax=uncultured Flavobacterium sp. TaxID=165435 RepID=UPI000B0EDBDD|nr:voltage-gated chloride channel family protein [uncultured Flavobacterium sp.]